MMLACCLSSVTILSLLSAAPPDLTNGDLPWESNGNPVDPLTKDITLGPTGMMGWVYYEGVDSGESRQILVTEVDAGSPADGILAVDDVILGVDGSGANPSPFSSDARIAFGTAIGAAEANNPATLKLLRWRAGVTDTVQITLQTMGAYSATAPYNCPKSALILEQGLDGVMNNQDAGTFGLNVLTLLAANDPTNPKNAARQATAQSWALSLMLTQDEIDKRLNDQFVSTDSKVAWARGHQLIVLAEYYLQTGDAQVLPSIEAMAVEICNGQSVLGATGHQFTSIARNNGVVNGPYNIGYGAVNSSGVPNYYALVLARECGVTRPELAPGIARATNFFASYAGFGTIPYGEHEPYTALHESNGKAGNLAIALALEGSRPDAAKYNAQLALAAASEREIGHNGAWFNYLWAPLGANVGGEEAAAAHFSRIAWRLDLNRRWDGGFNYDCWYESATGGSPLYNKTRFWANTAMLMTYAMPLRQTYMTGKNQNVAVHLSSSEVSDTTFADTYDATARTTSELVADLGLWSHKVQRQAAQELGNRTSEHAALVPQLIAIVNDDTAAKQRVGACFALGEIGDGAAAATLADLLTHSDELLRFAATEAMRGMPDSDKLTHLDSMLIAAATTIRPFDAINDPCPLQFAYFRLSELLFSPTRYPLGVIREDLINTLGVDRDLLYPAIRAAVTAPLGNARSVLESTFDNLTSADIEALAGALVDVAEYPAPADQMSKHGARRGGLAALCRNFYAEAVPLAKILADDYTYSLRIDALAVLEQYAGSSLLVNPDPQIIALCEYLAYADLLVTPGPPDIDHAQDVLDAIAADLNPVTPPPLKSIQSVTAQQPSLQLPATHTQLNVSATDLADGDSIYTWRKVHGAGEVTFAHNGTAAAKNTTVLFDGTPGNYLFEVTMSDSRDLTEVSDTVAVTLNDSGGGLPLNTGPTATPQSVYVSRSNPTPIVLSGKDPEGYPLAYTVMNGPSQGSLSGTAPHLVYTPNIDYEGADQFSFQVMDSEGATDIATIDLFVTTSAVVETGIYEPFDYPLGTLNGQSGPTEVGLDGSWTAATGSSTVTDGSLAFGNLSTTGRKYEAGGSWGGSRPISPSALAGAGLLNDGSTLWLGAVISIDAASSGAYSTINIGLANNGFAQSSTNRWIVDDGALPGSGIGFSMGNIAGGAGRICAALFRDQSFGGQTGDASLYGSWAKEISATLEPGATPMYIVCRITWNSDPQKPDLVELFQPVDGNLLLPAEPTSVLEAVVDQSSFDTLTFNTRDMVRVDEIRIGPSYYSVLAGTRPITVDGMAPTPDPIAFATPPTAVSDTSIAMEAEIAHDPTYGVEYYFTCTAGGGNDSGWQNSRSYTDIGLMPGAQYSYTVKTRDLSPFQNEGTASAESSVTLPSFWTVPDVVGMPQPAAEDFIVINNYTVGSSATAYDEVVPAGTVISQNPTGGASASGGTAVNLVVSLGPDNSVPMVDAGSDQLLDMTGPDLVVNLDGTVTDADAGDVVTTYWSVVSAPVGATFPFGDNSAVDTTVTLDTVGEYVLRLSADDQMVQASDDVVITVFNSGAAALTDTMPVGVWTSPAAISLTPGEEGFSSMAGGGAIDTGFNAPIVDYAFFTNGVTPYASGNSGAGGSSRISYLTNPGGSNARTSLWETSSTAGAADYTGRGINSLPETGLGNGTKFSVDISELGRGSVYVFCGSWQSRSDWLKVSMTGPNLPDVTTDSGNGDGDGNSATFGFSPSAGGVFYYAKRIDFSGATGYDTITFTTYESGNQQGYFSGVVITEGDAPAVDTTPPALASSAIVDDQGGAGVADYSLVAYTLTFSEDMDEATVDAGDFSNAGSASVVIGAIAEISLGVFTVEVTPTSAGTLQLQVSAGAAMTDASGNPLDTTSAIVDDTTISVQASGNTAPVASDDAVSTDEEVGVAITLMATDGDLDPLTYSVVTGPSHGYLTGTYPDLTYIPILNYSGSDSFTFKANDGTLDSNLATVAITVNAFNDAPVAYTGSAGGGEDGAIAITLSANDADLDSLTYVVVTGPSNGVLSGTAPNLTYTPNSNYNGSDSISFKANDGTVDSNIATVNITVAPVNDAPVFTANPFSTSNAEAMVAYSGTIVGSAIDVDAGANLTYALVSAQGWLFVAGDGTLSGTPGSENMGVNTFTVSVSDGIAPAVQATLNIMVVPPSTAVLTDNMPIAMHTTYPVAISVTPGEEGFASSTGGGAIDRTFNNPVLDYKFYQGGGTAYASGTSGAGGTSRISNMTNSGANDSKTKLWETSSTSGPADFTSKGVGSKPETGLGDGTTFTIDISGLGSGSVYVINGSWQARSDWLSVSISGAGQTTVNSDSGNGDGDGNSARFGFSPAAGGVLYYAKRIDFTAAENYDTITITVYESGNQYGYFSGVVLTHASGGDTTPPTLAGSDIVDNQAGANIDENTLVTYTVIFSEDMDETTVDAADFSNAGDATVSIGAITETSPGVFTVEVTPTSAGSLQLQVTAGATLTDVAGNPLNTSSAISDDTTLIVLVPNSAPTWTSNPVNELDATEDAAYSSTLADDASDANAGDTLTFTKVSGPAWLSVAANGDLSGTPSNDDVGANVFTVSVTDGVIATPAEATLNITVLNTNDAPVANDDSGVTNEDTTVAITLTASDVDAGDVLSYTVVSGPANGVLSGTAPNLTYTPYADFNGSDSFTFTANDGALDSNVATISLTVNAINDAPVAINGVAVVDEDGTVAVTLSATDVDNTIASYTVVSGPTNGVLSGTAPNLIYTPNSNYNGADSFTFQANDGTVDSNIATVSITVNAINDAPVFTADPFSASEATEDAVYNGTIAGSATDVDAADTLTYALVSPVTWLSVSTDGSLSGTPTSAHLGANSFTVSVSDGIAPAVQATLNITVVVPSTAVLTDNLPIALHTTIPVAVSVTPGEEGFASISGGGAIDTPFNNPVLDYAFYDSVGSYASGSSGSGGVSRISNLTNPDANDSKTNLWEASSTAGAADFTSKGVRSKAETGVGDGTTFTVDISGLESGSVYVINGSWQARSDWLSVSMTGSGQSPVAMDSGDGDGDGNPARFGFSPADFAGVYYYAKRIDFTGAGAYDTITFTVYESGNQSGYFSGVVLTQAPVGDTTAPTLAGSDIVDDQGGANVIEDTLVTYTVTFSEDMDDATVDASDFSNAGSSSVMIGAITETASGVFTVEVTPTHAGTLQLQVSAGATLADVAGNALDTTVAIVDDTAITVDELNVAPVWATNPVNEVAATEDAAYSSTLADDASDANAGDSLSYAKVSGPAWLSVAANGDLSGTPTNSDVGSNSFTVSVTDGIIATAVEATLNITVTNTNDAPVFTVDPINAADATEDSLYSGSIAGSATDADTGDTLTYAKVSGPAWLSVSSTGTLSGIPSNTDVGANVFTVSVTDNIIATPVQATLNITVINTNDAPVFTVDPIIGGDATEGEAYGGSIAGSATDVDAGASLSYAKVSGPAWLSVAANGLLSGTPGNSDVGANSFTVSVTDGIAPPVIATLNIEVIGNTVADYAFGETWIVGTVSGSIPDTFDSDNTYETITEVETTGKPSNRYSYLEHKWEFDVAGGDSVSLHVEAHHSANGEGDDFIFAYSTTGVDGVYTDMLTVTKTTDDDTEQSFTLPGGTSGIVHVRVLDTDQTPGNRNFDTLSIDHMYILSQPTP